MMSGIFHSFILINRIEKGLPAFFFLILLFSTSESYSQPTLNDSLVFLNRSETEKWLRQNNIPALGIGVIRSGKISEVTVYGELEEGKPAPQNTLWNVASLTKPITAVVTLKLVSAKKWNLDESLSLYFTDPDILNDSRSKILTTRHVLTHQTGFPNWRGNTEDGKLAFEFDPGTKYQYSGEGFEYLRKALEAKFQKSLEQLAHALIFKPLDLNETAFFWDEKLDTARFATGHNSEGIAYRTYFHMTANSADNLLTTVEDYATFLISVLNSQDISKAVFAEMMTPQVVTKKDKYFGLGFEIYDLGSGEYALSHGGSDQGVQTICFIFPKTGNGLLIFTNADQGYLVYEKVIGYYLGEDGKKIIDIETRQN